MMRTGYGEIFATRGNRYEDSMARWPAARDEEFAAMCRYLRAADGETLVDAPAGGAYLRRHLPAGVEYIAVDEAEQFHAACAPRLRPGDRAVHSTYVDMPLADASVDVLGSLTGLHHVTPREPAYAEWFRVLRPGGRLVIGDVPVRTAEGEFLNGFVDRYNSQGHDGRFLDGHDEEALRATGFVEMQVINERYAWRFDQADDAVHFCHELFGLDRPGAAEALGRTLREDLGLQADPSGKGWLLPWGLRFIVARRPVAG